MASFASSKRYALLEVSDETRTDYQNRESREVIKAVVPTEKDKAEIHIPSAEPLYQEIRIDNELKSGADMEIHIETDRAATKRKSEHVCED